MIQLKTLLNCIDNSGASIVECIQTLNKRKTATLGERIVVVVHRQRSLGGDGPGHGSASAAATAKVRRGDVRHAVIVRTKKQQQRKDGSVVRFDDNACVLVQKSGEPLGSRVTSVVAAELRGKKWSKILSLAPLHI